MRIESYEDYIKLQNDFSYFIDWLKLVRLTLNIDTCRITMFLLKFIIHYTRNYYRAAKLFYIRF